MAEFTAPTIKLGKATYKVVTPAFSYQGKVFTAEEASEDEELCATLLKIGSHHLEEVFEVETSEDKPAKKTAKK